MEIFHQLQREDRLDEKNDAAGSVVPMSRKARDVGHPELGDAGSVL